MAKRGTHIRERYWRALGKFVDEFASIEIGIHLLLWQRTRTPMDIARAVFSGVRIQDGMSYIKRVSEVRPLDAETQADQDYIFTQLNVIVGVRNAILHYGAQTNRPGEFYVTNWLTALNEQRIKEIPVSAKTLLQLTRDLRKIELHLMVRHLLREPDLMLPFPRSDLNLLNASWQYKPPEPPQHHRKTRDSAPKRQRQPRP